MTTVPDGLPSLAKGNHRPESGQACVMEYVSVITGNKFSDLPPCTAIPVAKAAQAVNDHLEDGERHMILPFIDRLASATGMNDALFKALAERIDGGYLMTDTDLGDEVYEYVSTCIPFRRWDDGKYHRRPETLIAFLEEVLTLHEQYVQHTVTPISPEALAKAKELIETKSLINIG